MVIRKNTSNSEIWKTVSYKTDAEKITDTMMTIRDIWKHADPELKQRMKTDFSNLLGEMT